MEETPTQKHKDEHATVSSGVNTTSLIKVIILIAVIGFILLLVFTFLSALRSSTPPAASPTATPSATSTANSDDVQFPLAVEEADTRTLRAGIQTDVFSAYALNPSEGWENTHESDPAAPTDTLVLTKTGYTLTIAQETSAGGFCVFPEDPQREGAKSFERYVGIPGIHAQFRRATSDDRNFTICEQQGDSYGYPTSFGHISYTVPANADPALLNEMDAMVASLSD